jgi:hypothetical protein
MSHSPLQRSDLAGGEGEPLALQLIRGMRCTSTTFAARERGFLIRALWIGWKHHAADHDPARFCIFIFRFSARGSEFLGCCKSVRWTPLRKLLQSKAIAIDNDLRGTLRNFGLKVGVPQQLTLE